MGKADPGPLTDLGPPANVRRNDLCSGEMPGHPFRLGSELANCCP